MPELFDPEPLGWVAAAVAWLVIVARIVCLGRCAAGPQRLLTLIVASWAVTVTVQLQPVAAQLDRFADGASNAAFWASIVIGDAFLAALVSRVVFDSRSVRNVIYLLCAANLIIDIVLRHEAIQSHLPVEPNVSWGTVLFVAANVAIPLYANSLMAYIGVRQLRATDQRRDRAILAAMAGACFVGAVQVPVLVASLMVAAAQQDPNMVATIGLWSLSSGMMPILNLSIAIPFAALPLLRLIGSRLGRSAAASGYESMWSDLIDLVPEVALGGGASTPRERAIWAEVEIRDAIAVLLPYRHPLPSPLLDNLNRTFDERTQAAEIVAMLLLAAEYRDRGQVLDKPPVMGPIDLDELAAVWSSSKKIVDEQAASTVASPGP